MNIQAKVALDKQKHPERFCRHPRCLWRVMKCDPLTREMVLAPNCEGGRCPRHRSNAPRNEDVLEPIRRA